ATSVVSHGVDVEGLNLMALHGVPEEPADYIQTSSRSGRKHVGLIVAVLPSYSLRATSVYQRFREYHLHLERMGSPVPVNRFARHAVKRTAPGVLMGLLLGRHGPEDGVTDYYRLQKTARRLLREDTPDGFRRACAELREDLRSAYALGRDVYPEGLERAM